MEFFRFCSRPFSATTAPAPSWFLCLDEMPGLVRVIWASGSIQPLGNDRLTIIRHDPYAGRQLIQPHQTPWGVAKR